MIRPSVWTYICTLSRISVWHPVNQVFFDCGYYQYDFNFNEVLPSWHTGYLPTFLFSECDNSKGMMTDRYLIILCLFKTVYLDFYFLFFRCKSNSAMFSCEVLPCRSHETAWRDHQVKNVHCLLLNLANYVNSAWGAVVVLTVW